ncbi:hypothetical protein JFJ08_15010 [Vibrio atlanticus]|nr:hypothetical protein [Vibrio atlanticus]
MTNVFLLQVHRDTYHLRKLIEEVSLHSDVFIHMDKKSTSDYSSLNLWLELNVFRYSVHLLVNRVPVYWAHYSQIEATILLLRSAKEEKNYDFFTLLSGDCFPIKPLPNFIKFLEKNEGVNFIAVGDGEHLSNRVNLYHFFIKNKYYRSNVLVRKLSLIIAKILSFFNIKNKIFNNYYLAKGSQWFCLTNEFVTYVIDKVDNNKLIESLKYTNCIDELFFQTLLVNSKFSKRHQNDNLRLIDWAGGNSPILLDEEYDYSVTNKFFARKINVENKAVFSKLRKLIDSKGE